MSIASVSQSGNSSSSMSIASIASIAGRSSVGDGSLGSQVLGPGSSHAGLVHWDHGTVGVRHQAVERQGRDGRETTKNNLERVSVQNIKQIYSLYGYQVVIFITKNFMFAMLEFILN